MRYQAIPTPCQGTSGDLRAFHCRRNWSPSHRASPNPARAPPNAAFASRGRHRVRHDSSRASHLTSDADEEKAFEIERFHRRQDVQIRRECRFDASGFENASSAKATTVEERSDRYRRSGCRRRPRPSCCAASRAPLASQSLSTGLHPPVACSWRKESVAGRRSAARPRPGCRCTSHKRPVESHSTEHRPLPTVHSDFEIVHARHSCSLLVRTRSRRLDTCLCRGRHRPPSLSRRSACHIVRTDYSSLWQGTVLPVVWDVPSDASSRSASRRDTRSIDASDR